MNGTTDAPSKEKSMSGRPSEKGELAIRYLQQYPDKATRAIAKMMKADYPDVFKDVEHARRVLRYRRGQSGKSDLGFLV